jgi:hypothetical protein
MVTQGMAPLAGWEQWQHEIIRLLQGDFGDALRVDSVDDVDWPSWRGLYLQGRTPRSAIDRAFERDF